MKRDHTARITRSSDGTEMEYLRSLPKVVPAGKVLVHNSVRPSRRQGNRGARFWLSPEGTERLEHCPCDWAPELGQHYRVTRPENE